MISLSITGTALLSGCAIHYFDKEAGVENVWGFGHMRMKVQEPHEGRQALIAGTESYGASIGTTQSGAFAALGWFKNHKTIILNEDAQFRVEWPEADFFSVRVGAKMPKPIYYQYEVVSKKSE
ncbi:hypothetical protein SH580_06960 [Coraliomargarita algicola]|uniref:Lipoprotein n=1 Tax=Coraliomargarita algicola TaxID=3092156 RepID=A0ABZ0RQC6_9BACT|nr:hypothetical protein [Coraliomargarita sp. J2-16]WPJ97449.1 hypothetical protein SH580_06960 [Coraliomargarita sp. J2-16]